MQDLLNEIEEALPTMTWEHVEAPREHDAKFFKGKAPEWILTVCSFEISSQGFPKGTRGYDGAAVHTTGTAIRLTRELAEKAFKLAEGKS